MPIWANPEIWPFLCWNIINFFSNFMSQNYQILILIPLARHVSDVWLIGIESAILKYGAFSLQKGHTITFQHVYSI